MVTQENQADTIKSTVTDFFELVSKTTERSCFLCQKTDSQKSRQEKLRLQIAENEKKKVRKRPDNTVQAEPGDNAKYIRHNMELFQLQPVDTKSPEQVYDRSITYFEICQRNDMKPSVAGYALALGIDRRTLWEITTGRNAKPRGVTDTIKRFYGLLNAQMEDYMQNGKINPVSGIFLMKNNLGYQDKQEIALSAGQTETATPEELEQKYADAIPADFNEN